MPLFRRGPRHPLPQLVEAACDDAELCAARDTAVATGDWRPAATLLARTRQEADRRALVAAVLADAAGRDLSWVDAWVDEDPSQHALLVRGWAGIERAWAVRGSASASRTSAEAFKAFHAWLADSEPYLWEAAKADPDDPVPWVALAWIAVGLGWDRASWDRLWSEYQARSPQGRAGYVPALQYLSAKWHGSHGDMYELVAKAPPVGWAAVLPLQAHIELYRDQLISRKMGFLDASVFWEDAARSRDLDVAIGWARQRPTHPLAMHDLSVVAYCAVDASRWTEAAAVFEITGHRSYSYPWSYGGDPAERLTRGHAMAMKRAGSRFWAED
ncbi:hypothetical protein [Thalassiella azotivora]